jgi:signal transduction histidine kinase
MKLPATAPTTSVDILLVDESTERLAALEAVLSPLGQRLIGARSGDEALRALSERDIAVVLVAIGSDRAGLDVVRSLKARERMRVIPVICIADGSDAALATEAYELGAADYLSRSVAVEILRAKVMVFVDLHRRYVRQVEALRRQTLSVAASTAELKMLNEELHRRQLELERAMTARSRFYASMSHELRTPINAVLGYSTLLLEEIYGTLNEKQAEGLERTQKAARHLLELVNDVLDLSKIEAGKIELRLQPVEFPSVIEDLFVTVKPLADAHGSALVLDHEGDPLKIISDPRRVRQILLNLFSNAIKFGEGKPIRVTCRPKTGETNDAGVAIEVADRGEGIAAPDQERIFQEFVQLGKSQLQNGTGLGLPISRRLARLLRGSLTVESTPGRGSTFRLVLPANADTRTLRGLEHEFPAGTTSAPAV